MLQMMMMMGGSGAMNGMSMDMAAQKSLPQISPTNYMQGYEERSAIRQAVHPQVRGGRVAQAMSGAMNPSVGGGMDPSSMQDPSTANGVLGNYGLQLPTHTNPFLFFKDQNPDGSATWAGNHPRVAKAVEGAMIGATTPGGNTIGENISNVAKTVLNIPGLYKQSQAAQMQAPFDMAHQIAALQDDQVNMQAKLASAYHAYATGTALLDKPTKAYNGQVYQDAKSRPYQINTITGKPEAVDGRPDPLEFEGSTKIGTPQKNTKYPSGVKTQSERMGFDAYVGAGGQLDTQGAPQDTQKYQRFVYASQGRSAAATGASGTSAKKGAGQAAGDVSEADRTGLKAAEDDAKQKEAHAKEKISSSQFANADDIPAARAAEQTRRQTEAKAARDKFNQMSADVQAKQPNSKISGGGSSRPTTIIHTDGKIEIH